MLDNGRRAVRLVEECLTRDVCSRHREEDAEDLLLTGHAPQQLHGDVAALGRGELLRQAKAGLRLGPIPRLSLQTGGKGGIHDITQWRHIIESHPAPQPHLLGQKDGSSVEETQHLTNLVVAEVGLVVMDTQGDGTIGLGLAKRHEQAHTHATATGQGEHLGSHGITDSIGVAVVEG